MCQKILKIPMCIFDVTILALVFAIIASPAIASPTINVSALHGGAIPAQPLLALPPGFVVDTLAPPANESGDEGIPKAPSSLRYVHAIIRHGDRAPDKLIPTDTGNNASTWPQGLGQLTMKGIRDQFRLGRLLRQHYRGFISPDYRPSEVQLRTSSVTRAQQSAMALLGGWFAPVWFTEEMALEVAKRLLAGAPDIAAAVSQTPLPLPLDLTTINQPNIVTPKEKDNDRFVFDEVKCPIASIDEENFTFTSPEVKAIEAANSDFLRFLAKNAGYPVDPVPFREIGRIYDPLKVELEHREEGHRWPKWVNETVFNRTEQLYEDAMARKYSSNITRRLWAGPLFGDILDRMQKVMELPAGARHAVEASKFFGYVGHDITVAGQLALFGITNVSFPSYSTAMLIELHEGPHPGRYNVKVFYKNETNGNQFWEHSLSSLCGGERCSPAAIRAARAYLIPENWTEECAYPTKWSSSTTQWPSTTTASSTRHTRSSSTPPTPIEIPPTTMTNDGTESDLVHTDHSDHDHHDHNQTDQPHSDNTQAADDHGQSEHNHQVDQVDTDQLHLTNNHLKIDNVESGQTAPSEHQQEATGGSSTTPLLTLANLVLIIIGGMLVAGTY